MPSFRSKWEGLATEAINPASLAIDKLPAADIVELMIGGGSQVAGRRAAREGAGSRLAPR